MQVTAKSNIKHDGKYFEKGATLEVSEDQAAKLLAAGVINPVEGVKPETPEPAVSEQTLGTDDDKKSEKAGIAEVANLPFSKSMTKEKLIGIARAKGLEVEKTATKDEVLALLNSVTPAKKDEDKGNEDEDNGEGATHGADTDAVDTGADAPAGEPRVPANPEENAPAQNTTDTDKEPAPAPKSGKSSK